MELPLASVASTTAMLKRPRRTTAVAGAPSPYCLAFASTLTLRERLCVQVPGRVSPALPDPAAERAASGPVVLPLLQGAEADRRLQAPPQAVRGVIGLRAVVPYWSLQLCYGNAGRVADLHAGESHPTAARPPRLARVPHRRRDESQCNDCQAVASADGKPRGATLPSPLTAGCRSPWPRRRPLSQQTTLRLRLTTADTRRRTTMRRSRS